MKIWPIKKWSSYFSLVLQQVSFSSFSFLDERNFSTITIFNLNIVPRIMFCIIDHENAEIGFMILPCGFSMQGLWVLRKTKERLLPKPSFFPFTFTNCLQFTAHSSLTSARTRSCLAALDYLISLIDHYH